MSHTQADIRRFLIEKTGIAPEQATDDSVILGSGLVDSFGLVALLADVEQCFGIFPDLMSLDPREYATLGGLTRIIQESLGLPPEASSVAATETLAHEFFHIDRLRAGHPAWASLPGLFNLMFQHFNQAGVKLPLVPGGEQLWLQTMERVPEMAGIVLGALQNGKLVGFASGQCKMLPAHLGSGLVGEISYVYVLPEVRRKGVARALVQHMLTWLSERKTRSIELQVLCGNTGAIEFWEKLDFKPELLQMRRLPN